jgi:hypothetical protein
MEIPSTETTTAKWLRDKQAVAIYSSRKQMPAKVRAFLDFYKVKFNH